MRRGREDLAASRTSGRGRYRHIRRAMGHTLPVHGSKEDEWERRDGMQNQARNHVVASCPSTRRPPPARLHLKASHHHSVICGVVPVSCIKYIFVVLKGYLQFYSYGSACRSLETRSELSPSSARATPSLPACLNRLHAMVRVGNVGWSKGNGSIARDEGFEWMRGEWTQTPRRDYRN